MRDQERLDDLSAVDVETLPPFSNQRARCSRCGSRAEIRVHFDRGCAIVRSGDHFHRLCRCGHEWVERCSEGPHVPAPE